MVQDIIPRGVEELIDVTEAHLDDALRDAEEAVRKYDLKYKRIRAQLITVGAVTSGVVVGAIPVRFQDAVILTPLETLLITLISKIYHMDQDDDFTKKVISRIVETGTVSLIAKAAINKLKMLPGIANIAADVLNAIIAGAIVFAIGEASAVIMERVYLGDIEKENLEWIDNIVDGKMGSVVKRVADIISANKTDISVKDIIQELVKNNGEI